MRSLHMAGVLLAALFLAVTMGSAVSASAADDQELGNVALLKSCYTKWNESKGSNADCWKDLLSETFSFSSLAGGRAGIEWTSDVKGKANIERYFQGLAADWEMIHFTPKEYVAQGDRVIMLGTTAWKNRKTGIVVESPKADVWRFADGKAIEFMEYYDTEKFFAAARGRQ